MSTLPKSPLPSFVARNPHLYQHVPVTAPEASDHRGVALESVLQEEIKEYCDNQWPRWKVIAARMDKKTTLPLGCQDLTVFANLGRVHCIETKARNKKPDADQLAWHKEMAMVGHIVHVVRNMDQFLEVVK